MLKTCAFAFLTLAMVAGVFSFEMTGAAAGIAKVLFLGLLVLFAVAFLGLLVRPNKVKTT